MAGPPALSVRFWLTPFWGRVLVDQVLVRLSGLNQLRYMILLHQSSVCGLLIELECCYTGFRAHRTDLTLYVRVFTGRLTPVPDIHGKWCRYALRPSIAALVAGFCS